jgi:hypothetical protein
MMATTTIPTAKLKQLQGKPVGGWWRMHQGSLEVKLIGGSWHRPHAGSVLQGPAGLLLHQGMVLTREA